jgi:hypothetical protein
LFLQPQYVPLVGRGVVPFNAGDQAYAFILQCELVGLEAEMCPDGGIKDRFCCKAIVLGPMSLELTLARGRQAHHGPEDDQNGNLGLVLFRFGIRNFNDLSLRGAIGTFVV